MSFIALISICCRLSAIKFLKRWLRTGANQDEARLFPPSYITEMSKHSTFVDSLFINTIAQMLGHDIVVVHMHEDSVANGLFSWIYGGGSMGNGAPAQTCPLFLSIKHQLLIFSIFFCFQFTSRMDTTRPATSSHVSPTATARSSPSSGRRGASTSQSS